MSLSLHEAFVPTARQMIGSVRGLVDKAEAHCVEHSLEAAELMEARLADDMWPLPMHVRSCWMHGAYTLDQIPTGEFTPDFTDVPGSWDAMRDMLAQADEKLAATSESDMAAIEDTTVGFVLGGKRLMEFKAKDFLLSFNQPNLMFHATTFYDILRHKGIALTKRDFLGRMRLAGR